MKFDKCLCGNGNFEITRDGKIECLSCGKYLNPFSAVHYEMALGDKKKYWVILTPHFIERFDEHFSKLSDEDLLEHCIKIQKASKINKVQATKYFGKHIYWKYFFNKYRKRYELTMISITRKNTLTTKFHKDVEFVTVNFNE